MSEPGHVTEPEPERISEREPVTEPEPEPITEPESIAEPESFAHATTPRTVAVYGVARRRGRLGACEHFLERQPHRRLRQRRRRQAALSQGLGRHAVEWLPGAVR